MRRRFGLHRYWPGCLALACVLGALAALAAGPARAQTEPAPADDAGRADPAALADVLESYLLENPQDLVSLLVQSEQARAAQRMRLRLLARNAMDAARASGRGWPVLASADGAPRLVVFADYTRPESRAVLDLVTQIRQGGQPVDLSVFALVWDDDPTVDEAAHRRALVVNRAMLAAARLGVLARLHGIVLAAPPDLDWSGLEAALADEETVDPTVDPEVLFATLTDPDTDEVASQAMLWAAALGVRKLPAVVIDGRRLTGEITPESLRTALLEAMVEFGR